MTPQNTDLLVDGLDRIGLPVHPGQVAALVAFHDALHETTLAGLNLTGIRDERESVIRNLLDSLAPWHHVGDPDSCEGQRLVEIGAGPGIPGIPLAIVLPFREVVLVESKEKKCAFMRDIADALNDLIAPRKITVERGDANRIPVPKRFDRLVARAFAALPKIMRVADRFVAYDGRSIAYKGTRERITEEMAELGEAQRDRCEVVPVSVPHLEGVERHVIRIRPHSKTPREHA